MMHWRGAGLALALVTLVFQPASVLGVPEDDEGEDHSFGEGDGSCAPGDDSCAQGWDDREAKATDAVYVMEHGFLNEGELDWKPRGTLLLSSSGSGSEARLSDAKEFVQLRPELPGLMNDAAGRSVYYAVRMYSPENPKRVLQASVPAKMLAERFEDWHDILEVTVGAVGVPIGLSYRVRHTLGLALFEHTQVHLSEPSWVEGPRVPPNFRNMGGPGGKAGQEPPGPQSFLRRYWWVILIGFLLLSSTSGDAPSSGGKGGGGGGGGRRA